MAKGEQQARQQAASANTQFNQAQAAYDAPDPDVVAARERRQRWREWYDKKQYDTQSPDGPLYATTQETEAATNRYLDRRGTGVTALSGSASPTLLAMARLKTAAEMGQRTATGRTNALIAHNADIEGSALPYIQIAEAHRQAALDMANQNRMQANSLLTQRLAQPSPFWGIGAAALGAAGQAAGAYFGRPPVRPPTTGGGGWI